MNEKTDTTENTIPMPTTAQEVHETLADGAKILVHFKTTPEGVTPPPEMVKVRLCPRNEFVEMAQAVLQSLENEEALCAFYVAKPVEWVQSLTEESFSAVMEEGGNLNFSRFEQWFGRRQNIIRMAKVTAPAIQAAVDSRARKS